MSGNSERRVKNFEKHSVFNTGSATFILAVTKKATNLHPPDVQKHLHR